MGSVDLPPTRFATSADGTSIAFQVTGSGPVNLVLVAPRSSHLDLRWTDPGLARLLDRLGSFSRLISMDRRGSGLSDRDVGLPAMEQEVEDLQAVLDAVKVNCAYLLGSHDGAACALMFAAAHPERTLGVVAFAAFARALVDDDYPIGHSPAEVDALVELVPTLYGTTAMAALVSPSRQGDEDFAGWLAAYHRAAASPRTHKAWMRSTYETDLRAILPAVQAPVLVMRRAGSPIREELARYLADHLPHGRYVELPGQDIQIFTDDIDTLLDEVEQFITGTHNAVDPDRILATVLFTDIVDSTQRAVNEGDARWRHLLDQHDAIIGREVSRHRGRLVKSTGDGALILFDGPARGVRCACAIRDALDTLGLPIRAGLHTGETELRGEDVSGVAVHLASRVAGQAGASEVVVSRTVVDLVYGSGLTFENRGPARLKGFPETWELHLTTATT